MSSGPVVTMRTIYIIRHGEKPPDPNPGSSDATTGINVDGDPYTSSLTPVGWQRAGALSTLFAPYQIQDARAWVEMPTEMFSPSYPDDPTAGCSNHRTNETIFPLGQLIGLTIDNTSFPEGQEKALGEYVANEQAGTTLICWEHTAIPTIANAIVAPAQQSEIPQSWPDDRYDVVWAFTRPATRPIRTRSCSIRRCCSTAIARRRSRSAASSRAATRTSR